MAAAAAAKESGRPVVLLSAPAAAGAAGIGWFDALAAAVREAYPEVPITAVLDCGDRPGHALAALRHGFSHLRYEGRAIDRIRDIAEQRGAVVLTERPASLDLLEISCDQSSMIDTCRRWLEAD